MDPVDLGTLDTDTDSLRIDLIVIDEVRRWSSAPLEHTTLIAFGPSDVTEDIDMVALDWFVSQQDDVRRLATGLGCQYNIAPRQALMVRAPFMVFDAQLPADAPTFGYLLVSPGAPPRLIAFDADRVALRSALVASELSNVVN
jgi:hypothetical protein